MSKGEAIFLWCSAAVFSISVTGLFFSYAETRKEYEKACAEVHGKTVFDGRQYQCLK